ncbi:hypothetical protein [Nonomuraea typhae]|uniref:hypothetical protein n=1 Tax=Nonomuraea typhae TaxID=2603600 RepID=UPI0012FB4324|nr:hypothetical protein [Nonomuraea typhae]
METGERRAGRGWVLGGAVLVAAWLAGGRLPSFAGVTYAVVIAIGAVAVAAAFWPRADRAPAAGGRLPGWVFWAVPAGAFGLVEVWALVVRDPAWPTFSDLMDPVLLAPEWRGLFWVAWLVTGWGLVRR